MPKDRKADVLAPVVPAGTTILKRRKKQKSRLDEIMASMTTPDRTKKVK